MTALILGDKAKRLVDAARASRLTRALLSHDSWSPEQLEAHQREAQAELARHAAAHSPFWRERLAGGAVPVLDKQTLMANFDEAAADPRLRLATLETHLAALSGDQLLDSEFRVLASSGTTGQRGVFAYDRREWALRIAAVTRASSYLGFAMLRRRRVATVGATSPLHISARFSMSADVGLHRFCRLDVRSPIRETVAALNDHRPDQVIGYPSILALLAEEQLARRLTISPAAIVTTSESRTEVMTRVIKEAWPQARLQDMYGVTEGGVIGADCELEAGMHLFEDIAIFENVDEGGRPVPDGEIGAQLLMTDLFTHSQPKLRYALSDSVVVTSEPCACGRPYRRLLSIAGRSDESLDLPASGGGTVRLHALALRSPMAAQADVLQYQAVHDRSDLHLLVVPRAGADASRVAEDVRGMLDAALRSAGAAVQVHVHLRDALSRDSGHGAKVRLLSSASDRALGAARPDR